MSDASRALLLGGLLVASACSGKMHALGHGVRERSGYQGDTQSIMVLGGGRLAGVSDPRSGGAAVPVRARR